MPMTILELCIHCGHATLTARTFSGSQLTDSSQHIQAVFGPTAQVSCPAPHTHRAQTCDISQIPRCHQRPCRCGGETARRKHLPVHHSRPVSPLTFPGLGKEPLCSILCRKVMMYRMRGCVGARQVDVMPQLSLTLQPETDRCGQGQFTGLLGTKQPCRG